MASVVNILINIFRNIQHLVSVRLMAQMTMIVTQISAPCRNLQTVLDRATDGADIYVTSETLPFNDENCTIAIDIGDIDLSPENLTCCKREQ